MARLGKKPIAVPDKVQVEIKDGRVLVRGEKGKLEHEIFDRLTVTLENNQITIANQVSEKQKKDYRRNDALHGLMRTLVLNMLRGVKDGFEKILEIHGTGYKSEVKGKQLTLTVGFTHPVTMDIPEGIALEVLKNTIIYVRGINKELVGNFAAKIRAVFPPESYKGTGIRYRGEYVRQKVGKAAAGVTK